jgi:hypothetical protein
LRFYETSCETRAVRAGAVGAGAETGDTTWYCTSSVYATLMWLFEAPFSSHLAPAISVKKTFTGKVVFQNKILDHYQLSLKLHAFLMKKMVFGTNGSMRRFSLIQ